MRTTEKRYYEALRRIWNEPVSRALKMARDRVRAEESGITFDWEIEQESPRDVFGEPDLINGPFYDPGAEFYCCVARDRNGRPLDSLGMIDGAWDRTDFRGYWFAVECEMAGEALAELDRRIQSTPNYDPEETLA